MGILATLVRALFVSVLVNPTALFGAGGTATALSRTDGGASQYLESQSSGRVISVPCPDGTSYSIRLWQTEDGLPQNTVTGIIQTSDGYLWLGTYDGLARFDGARFVVFNSGNTPGLQNSRISCFFEDSVGTLWIGHDTGDLTRYSKGRFERVTGAKFHQGEKIVGIGTDSEHSLWLVDQAGQVERLSDGIIYGPDSQASTALGFVALTQNTNGNLWVSRSGQVGLLRPDRLEKQSFDRPNGGGYYYGIAASHDGGLWVVVDGRVRKWREKRWAEDWGASPWGNAALTSVLELQNGTIAVGTLDQGLYLLLPDHHVLHFDHTSGLPQDWIRCLCEDREGTLWLGSGSAGMVAMRPARVSTVNAPDQWQARPVLSVNTTSDGALWVGTEGAGLYKYFEGSWTRFTEKEGVANAFVWSFAEDGQGRIWAGTWGGGLFAYQNGRFEHPSGFEDINVAMPGLLASGRDGALWVATGAGLIKYKNGQPEWIGRSGALENPDVRALVEDRDGTLWFGMSGGGLGRYKNGTLTQFRKSSGLSSDFVQCLLLEPDGTLWIGTSDGGLNRLKNGRFSAISSAQGLPNNVICHIADDGLGFLWLGTHGGILRLAKDDLNRCAEGEAESVPCINYNRSDGMPTLECAGGLQSSGCRTRDGKLWFSTPRGLVNLDPARVAINLLPPPVVVEDMELDGRRLPATGAPQAIPPGRHRFEFHYAGLSFAAPEKVRFQCRLAGLDTAWVPAGSKRSAVFNYLPPGSYTFEVMACNNDGIWNSVPATRQFTVEPFFWQTWWFTGLVASGAISGSVLVVQARARRKLRAQMEAAERKNAIERERSRIAQDIHDDLGASLTRITMLSQTAQSELNDPAQAAVDIGQIYKTARELTRSLDEIVWAVNPRHDTLDSLASYLGQFAQDILRTGGVRCRLDVPVSLPPWHLRAEIRHNLFLAFKEALNNALKHAGATEIRISLVLAPDGFTLAVEDNGSGFSPSIEPAEHPPTDKHRLCQGNGLANMQRRISEIGGVFHLESGPGGGTRVRFKVNVDQ